MASSKGRSERKRLAIRDARPIIEEQELEKLLENIDVNREAVQAVEESANNRIANLSRFSGILPKRPVMVKNGRIVL